MKIKAGTERIDLKEFELLQLATAKYGEVFDRRLKPISPEEWQRMRGDQGKPARRAIPIYIAYLGLDLGHRIYPAPDKDMEIQFAYWRRMVVV